MITVGVVLLVAVVWLIAVGETILRCTERRWLRAEQAAFDDAGRILVEVDGDVYAVPGTAPDAYRRAETYFAAVARAADDLAAFRADLADIPSAQIIAMYPAGVR